MGWRRKYFTGYRDPKVWAELGLVGDSLSFTTDETVTKLGIGYIKDREVECPMDTAIRFTLLNAGENGEINAKQMLNRHTRLAALFEAGLVADGWYLDEEGNKQRGWVFHKDGVRLHWNHISSYYSYDNAQFPAHFIGATTLWRYDTGYSGRSFRLKAGNYSPAFDYKKLWESEDGFQPIPLIGNERVMTNYLDDKEVLKHINKSLNRMVKSGKAVQVTAGRGRTFRWNAWGWLEDYRQQHLVTIAKQRKLGDEVNGWVFTKGHVINKYGVEICDHEWHPIEPVVRYTVCQESPRVRFEGRWIERNGSESYEREPYVIYHSIELPYFCTDEAKAQEIVEQLNNNAFPHTDIGIRMNGEPVTPRHKVGKHDVNMRVEGSAHIEDFMHPKEMYERIQLSNYDIADELNSMLIYQVDKVYASITRQEE